MYLYTSLIHFGPERMILNSCAHNFQEYLMILGSVVNNYPFFTNND